jgi:hypothetical protein
MSLPDERNWIKYITIDPNRLDDNWIEQPKKYLEVASKCANLRASVDACKLQLDELQAKLDYFIRKSPAKYGLEKVTEGGVLTAIKRHKKYLEVCQLLLIKKKQLGFYEGVLSALDHRKKALENMVFLHGQSYFSKPRESSVTEDWTKKKARQITRKGINNNASEKS